MQITVCISPAFAASLKRQKRRPKEGAQRSRRWVKLYELGPTRSIRARWTLQELGVAFEPIRVELMAGENQRPEFLKINPAGKLPVLVDDD